MTENEELTTKRKPGRPKGSKSSTSPKPSTPKKTTSKAKPSETPPDQPKRGRGRPKGSKDKVPNTNRLGKHTGAHLYSTRPGVIQSPEDQKFVAGLLSEILVEYKKTKVTSDEELEQRLDDYFSRCASTGQIPTVEEMCMSTGYSDRYIYDIEVGVHKGFSTNTSLIIKKAKHFLKTFDAKLVVTGKMNFLAYCFRAKNYYGMSDKQEFVFAPTAQLEGEISAEEIAKRYMSDGKSEPIETTFEE